MRLRETWFGKITQQGVQLEGSQSHCPLPPLALLQPHPHPPGAGVRPPLKAPHRP